MNERAFNQRGAIFFDLDGTIINSNEGITKSLIFALEEVGRADLTHQDLSWCIGPPLIQSLNKLLNSEEEAKKALSLYRQRYSDVGCFENYVYEGIPEALSALKSKGHQLYIATAKPTVFAKKIIERTEFRELFTEVYGTGLDGSFNDKADLLEHIIYSHKLDKQQTSMIGDRSHDMIAAKKNSVRALGVLWGFGTQKELVDSGADQIISKPKDLVALL